MKMKMVENGAATKMWRQAADEQTANGKRQKATTKEENGHS